MVCPAGQRPRRSLDSVRADLVERLQAKRPEIEEAILVRLYAVSGPTNAPDAEYAEGLRAALTAAVGYGLAAVERGEERSGPVPSAMLVQARHAARKRVGLQVVLRRYAAGYSALGDFLMQEAGSGDTDDVPATVLYRLQRELTALFDRLLAAISAEYEREASHTAPSQRLAERVKRLLAGELVDTAELDYDFDAHHLGAIATGSASAQLLRDLLGTLDRRLLFASGGGHTIWVWLGGRRKLEVADLAHLVSTDWPPDVSLAVGEPARGLRGWRLTHRQAQAALTVALRRPQALTRYADIALLASVLRDDDLVEFLTVSYLNPLSAERDGETLRQTLRAYFAAGRNVSSAASALGVTRHTVTNRLRTVEQRIQRSIDTCWAEIEIALRLLDSRPQYTD